jgi:hypothetical protein
MTSSWLAAQTVPFLTSFYTSCEKRLGTKFLYQRSIIRPFSEEQEKILWLKKAKNELDDFLDNIIHRNNGELTNCKVDGEYGLVKASGNLDVTSFIKSSEEYFSEFLTDEEFNHEKLKISESDVSYGSEKAQNIIFCEGHLLKNNPFFNWIQLKPAKGELFTLTAKNIGLKDNILNKGGFLFEAAKDTFKCGATYEWSDLSDHPTGEGAAQLKAKVGQLITGDYTVVKHEAGIRPSSSDRRPVVGPHPKLKQLFVFNGLGTKGVMLAPYFANNFVLFYLQKQDLHPEVDVKRFYSLCKSDPSKK